MISKDTEIFALVVLYNKNYKDSLTLQSIGTVDKLHCIVLDNSTADYGNAALGEVEGVTYLSMGGNMGLSKAYNRGIDAIKGQKGLLCLFDDDTEIPADYFTKTLAHYGKGEEKILLPLVYDDQGLMSPGVMRKYLCYRASSVAELKEGEFTGINSGMAVDLGLFDDYRYDEAVFLDYIDHGFIRDMYRRGVAPTIMEDVVLHQTFSDVVNSKESAKIRFRILKKDLHYFYRETLGSRLFYHYVIDKRRIKLCLKYKTLSFLFL